MRNRPLNARGKTLDINKCLNQFFLTNIFKHNKSRLAKVTDQATLKDLCVDSLEIAKLELEIENKFKVNLNSGVDITLQSTVAQIKERVTSLMTALPA